MEQIVSYIIWSWLNYHFWNLIILHIPISLIYISVSNICVIFLLWWLYLETNFSVALIFNSNNAMEQSWGMMIFSYSVIGRSIECFYSTTASSISLVIFYYYYFNAVVIFLYYLLVILGCAKIYICLLHYIVIIP